MLQVDLNLNFQRKKGRGYLLFKRPKFSGLKGEVLEGKLRWSGDVVILFSIFLRSFMLDLKTCNLGSVFALASKYHFHNWQTIGQKKYGNGLDLRRRQALKGEIIEGLHRFPRHGMRSFQRRQVQVLAKSLYAYHKIPFVVHLWYVEPKCTKAHKDPYLVLLTIPRPNSFNSPVGISKIITFRILGFSKKPVFLC